MNIDLNDYCSFCGAVLPVTKMANIRLYCSPKCCGADEYRLRRAAVLEARADRVCDWCRKPIPPEVHGLARYCNETCAHRMEHAKRREKRAANQRHPPRPCLWCGCTITRPKRSDQKYCSAPCRLQAKRTRQRKATTR